MQLLLDILYITFLCLPILVPVGIGVWYALDNI